MSGRLSLSFNGLSVLTTVLGLNSHTSVTMPELQSAVSATPTTGSVVTGQSHFQDYASTAIKVNA